MIIDIGTAELQPQGSQTQGYLKLDQVKEKDDDWCSKPIVCPSSCGM
jgi:hypothetical protein